MGPRPNGRGKLAGFYHHDPTVSASMGPRPNGRGKLTLRLSELTSFSWLQWGRGQTAAESKNATKKSARSATLQWGRGQTAAERRQGLADLITKEIASMGPRPNGRGKYVVIGLGRVAKQASMGPRPNGRGKRHSAAVRRPRRLASMGPRPNGRGKGTLEWVARNHTELQWGRGKTAAESESSTSSCGILIWLQWGRGQTAAESLHAEGGEGYAPASMGPRPNGRGKRTAPCRPTVRGMSFNGAAAKRPRKGRP